MQSVGTSSLSLWWVKGKATIRGSPPQKAANIHAEVDAASSSAICRWILASISKRGVRDMRYPAIWKAQMWRDRSYLTCVSNQQNFWKACIPGHILLLFVSCEILLLYNAFSCLVKKFTMYSLVTCVVSSTHTHTLTNSIHIYKRIVTQTSLMCEKILLCNIVVYSTLS